MSKARTLADFISDGSEFADGTISVAEVSGAAPLASPTFTGTVTAGDLTLSDGTPIINFTDTDTGVDHQINASSGIGNLAINVDQNNEGSNAGLIFRVGGSGTANQYFRMAANGDTRFYDSSANTMLFIDESVGVTINDDGADKDFRVESDTVSHMLFVDAGNDRIGINQSSPQAILDIKGNTTTYEGMAKIYLTDVSGNPSSRNWAIGNGGSAFGNFTIGVSNVATGDPMANGTHKTPFIIQPSGSVVINEDSNDADFRVESDTNTHALFVDASADAVGFSTSTPRSQLDVLGTIRANSYTVITNLNINNDAVLFNYTADGADLTPIYASAGTAGGSLIHMESGGSGTLDFRSAMHGTDSSTFSYTTAGKYLTLRPTAKSSGELIVNQDSHSGIDFRVESDNETHALFVEAGEDRVGINQSNPSYTLHVGDTNTENMGIGWMRMETFAVDIHDADTRWYKLANYTTNILQGQLFMISARGGGANQTNGGRIQHGTISGYNNTVQNRWGDLGTNYGYNNYYVEVGTDTNVYLRVPPSVYGGSIFCTFQGRGNWVFDGTYVTSAP